MAAVVLVVVVMQATSETDNFGDEMRKEIVDETLENEMKVNSQLTLELRAERGWSQEELAQVSGLNLRTVQRIEKAGVASLQSKRSLASAFGLEIQALDMAERDLPLCPDCKSAEVFEYEGLIDSTTIGGELLPKLASGWFSSAKMRTVVCGECGFLRFFVEPKALHKLKSSKHWNRVQTT